MGSSADSFRPPHIAVAGATGFRRRFVRRRSLAALRSASVPRTGDGLAQTERRYDFVSMVRGRGRGGGCGHGVDGPGTRRVDSRDRRALGRARDVSELQRSLRARSSLAWSGAAGSAAKRAARRRRYRGPSERTLSDEPERAQGRGFGRCNPHLRVRVLRESGGSCRGDDRVARARQRRVGRSRPVAVVGIVLGGLGAVGFALRKLVRHLAAVSIAGESPVRRAHVRPRRHLRAASSVDADVGAAECSGAVDSGHLSLGGLSREPCDLSRDER